jgi:hypothetical protein
MSLKIGSRIYECLKNKANKKLTARQIADWILEAYPSECQAKKANSSTLETDSELVQQLVAEIGAIRPKIQKAHPEIKTIEEKPRKYYYSEISDSEEVARVESEGIDANTDVANAKLNEHDLYPLLAKYLLAEFQVVSKRIDEKRSSNKQGPKGNEWIHPDIVGMEDLGVDWKQEVQDCVKHHSDKRAKLWSFEVKLLINRSNVRKCYFQAVSNSSWANFGYLVAPLIDGVDTLKELRILSATHGIGLIELSTENPPESRILIPARERSDVDWDVVNRLVAENKDFLGYVKLLKRFYQTGELRSGDWDMANDVEQSVRNTP